MNDRTRLGLGILGGALALGILGDILLRETPWGLNAGLWAIGLVAAAVTLTGRLGGRPAGDSRWLLPLAAVFALLLAWRASPVLAALNLAVALACLALAVVRAPSIRRAPVFRYAAELARLVAEAFSAVFLLTIEDVTWKEIPRGRWTRETLAVLRGLAFALPLLLVFGALFAAADAVFDDVLTDLIDVERPFVHLLVIVLWTWVAVGLLRHVLGTRTQSEPSEEESRPARIGVIETTIVLALLNALFLAFVIVQLRYLFGGDERVQRVEGLTYAEYARSGFFELVTAAALVLPLLLGADWLVRRGDRRHLLVFRALAGTLVLLLFVIMASALERMRLYTDAYGLTELRLYVTAFMLWLTVVFVLLLGTVLRGRPARFAFGAFLAGLAATVALNALNPDALIARTNMDRVGTAAGLDPYYLGDLSGDAVPAIVEELETLPRRERVVTSYAIVDRWGSSHGRDWRTWNWGRSRADEAVTSDRGRLEDWASEIDRYTP